ncbi:hypothetical protein K458DRAFT_381930 [Lentithecium fluviatile CBS 122367]|uniref:Nephrocystin 3-like N-terminal domain-containing protein n=1 Tax=Lentithecium fluviatile CBS 122367 TaxID=1168545 RepID=A0A6G1JNP2_9PLEO|nr:hypothetical protein K458DRAFT_381930 [Lentithecium fluviatile CBS 122367]
MSLSSKSVEVAMLDPGPELSLLDDAVGAIRSTLSEPHQSTFRDHADATSLIAALQDFCQRDGKEKRRLTACEEKFALFTRAFEGYFDVLSLCIDVRGKWLGRLWAIVELVFQVGSNYTLFLEKVADIFETIARVLPPYQQVYEACKHRWQFRSQSHDQRPAVLMSSVYADVVQFSLELYRFFSRGLAQGVALRHLHLSSPTIFWRPLDSRLALLETRLVRHKQWLEGEVYSQEQDLATIARLRRHYIEHLHQPTESSMGAECVEYRMTKRMRRVDKVKAWLSNACSYRDIYEHRIQQRHPNSCAWFLRTDEYCKWRNAPFDHGPANDAEELKRTWQDRVLFVQANPGFGKSFISGAVIDDLNSEADDLNIDDDHEPPTVAFFHFNAAHSYCLHPNDAFRALAYQLIDAHRHDRSTLDAVSLLMRKIPPDARASSDDVLAVLSLLLHQHPTFLVIDGIDECNDLELFLTLLPEVCRKSDTRTLLFSRPGIDIPHEYQRWASDAPYIVRLDEQSNISDIEAYVGENLNRMADQGFFGINMDRSLIAPVAGKANGSFLWASLLLKYLLSPGLTPDERQAVLQNAHRLEGLESIYQHILSMLELRPQNERDVVVNIFRWVSLSINRMCMQGFHKSVAIIPGQRTKNIGYFSDFLSSVSPLTCGLVEVTECSVVFTHRSVAECLKSPPFKDSPFSLFDESILHAHLAARCLSFLAYDVPKRPLGRLRPHIRPALSPNGTSSGISMRTSRSGDSGYKSMSSASDSEGMLSPTSTTTSLVPSHPVSTPFDEDLPFLRYSSLCWPIHLTRALSNPSHSNTSNQPTPYAQVPYLPSLSAFLTDRAAVTAWVEASWRYNLPPNLSRLVPLLSDLKACIPPATVEGREIRWVVQGLRELSNALNELKEEFGTTLRENPSLVWQWRGPGGSWRTGKVGGSGEGNVNGDRGGLWSGWDEGAGRAQDASRA